MKGRIKHRHHGHPGAQHGSHGPDRRQGGLVMQGGKVMQRVKSRNDRVIQAHWLDKAMSPVDDAMADCLQAAWC